jgi:hypothetical protein
MALQHDKEVAIPVYGSLEPVYGEGSQLEEAQLRFDRLKAKFVELYEQEPELFARSPGNQLQFYSPFGISLSLLVNLIK